MSGPKRNPDKLNTIGIVVVAVCAAVLVYVTIVLLQAFYMNDTSDVDTMAEYGGQDITAKSHKAEEMDHITTPAPNQLENHVAPGTPQTYRIDIHQAMKLIVRDAANDPSHLIPALPASTKATIEPIFGRPKPILTAPPAAPAGATPATPAAAGSGAGSAAAPAAPAAPAAGHRAGSAAAAPAAPAARHRAGSAAAAPAAPAARHRAGSAAGSAAAEAGHAH